MDWFEHYVAQSQGVTPAPERTRRIALRLHVESSGNDDAAIRQLASSDPERFLDALDMGLHLIDVFSAARSLDHVLADGGSAWTVAADRKSLQRRVPLPESEDYETAVDPEDQASEELKRAWAKVYGRNPDASYAWNHAIKAVEHILKPIVTPNNPTATLGHGLGQLRSQSPLYDLVLRDNGATPAVIPLDAFEKILHMIWPNPDRHGSSEQRAPTQQEAQAVVQLAVLVVQWGRTGILVKK